jgi:L-idonate 5-dehydrogenase
MKAYYLYGPKDLRLDQVDRPPLADDQVLVRVRSGGICGSDLHYYEHGRNGDFVPERPFVLGHEFAGEIADAGIHAKSLPVGSRVAVDPSHPCRKCSYCLDGRYNLCSDMRYFGSAAVVPPFDGSFREYAPVRATCCHLIPPSMPFEHAALLEPLSVALQGVKQAGNIAGKRMLVCGAGPIGQLLGMVARHYGAERIAVSDLRPSPLKIATSIWADIGVQVDQPSQLEEASKAFGGFDVVIEASGAAAALQTAYQHCKPGGTIVQLGFQGGMVQLPANQVMQKELTVRGSFRFAHVFAKALDLLANGHIDLRPLVTDTFGFDDLVAGFEAAQSSQSLKVVINFQP